NQFETNEFKLGDEHENIKEVKQLLNKIGFDGLNSTNIFDKKTEERVIQFQQYYGLEVTRVLDQKTLNKIFDIFTSRLQKGKNHEDSMKLKGDVSFLGFGIQGSKGTTYFGAKTEASVKSFQEYYVLVVDGIADDVTLRKIAEIRNTPLQKGKSHPDTVQLKKDLAFLGFPVPGNGTDYHGEKTKTKVEEFQRKYKLVVNGI